MDIEQIAVHSVSLKIAKCQFAKPFIKWDDRGPALDGEIAVYRKSAQTKDDIICFLPVQVKGCTKLRITKEQKATYSLNIADLKIYLQAGGVLFFVVEIRNREANRIFCKSLLPYDIKLLLQLYSSQKSCSVNFDELPTEEADIDLMLIEIAENKKIQVCAINSPLISIADLVKSKTAFALKTSFTVKKESIKSSSDLLKLHKESYIYAELEHGITLPVGIGKLHSTYEKINKDISVNGKVYYTVYEKSQFENVLIWKIGKSISFKFDYSNKKMRIDFEPSGTLSERIVALEFLISFIENHGFKIAGEDVILPDEKSKLHESSLNHQKKHLEWLTALRKVLTKMGVDEDIDYSALDEAMLDDLSDFVNDFYDRNIVKLPYDVPMLWKCSRVANMNFLIVALERNKGEYELVNFNEAEAVIVEKEDGSFEKSSLYLCLGRKEFLKASNINYDKILSSIKSLNLSEYHFEGITFLILELLHASDKQEKNCKILLTIALELSSWLKNNAKKKDKVLVMINYLQCIKRIRSFTDEENRELLLIAHNKTNLIEFRIAAHLLLDEQTTAGYLYAKLSPKKQTEFKQYPIFNLWKA